MTFPEVTAGSQTWSLDQAHVLDWLAALPERSVHCWVTSPPYWSLRDYKLPPSVWGGEPGHEHVWTEHLQPAANGIVHAGGMSGATLSSNSATRKPKLSAFCPCGAWRGCLGLEPSPELFVEHMVQVFELARRALRDDGVCWINMGDSYSNESKHGGRTYGKHAYGTNGTRAKRATGLKPLDLCMIPARLALALQSAGWYLRSEVVWCKRNPMPESVSGTRWERCRVKWADCPGCSKCSANDGYVLRRGTWRPTRAHEVIWMLMKSQTYYADQDAVRTPLAEATVSRDQYSRVLDDPEEQFAVKHDHETIGNAAGANMRDYMLRDQTAGAFLAAALASDDEAVVAAARTLAAAGMRDYMLLAPEPSKLAHYASYPTRLPETFIKVSTSDRGVCPSCGAQWARVVDRKVMVIDRSERTHDMGRTRTSGTQVSPAETETIGWRPTCSCPAAEPVPAIVGDMFVGTGTTLMVARRLGRRAIGCDLSGPYCEMARQRVREDLPLFNGE
jgi:DNA modification methylase